MAHESDVEEEEEELKERFDGEGYDELAEKLEKFNPEKYEEYKEEFGEYVDEHGFFTAMYMLWNEHTSLSLTRVALVLAAVYTIRAALLAAGFSGIASVILSLITVFALARMIYWYDTRNTASISD